MEFLHVHKHLDLPLTKTECLTISHIGETLQPLFQHPSMSAKFIFTYDIG